MVPLREITSPAPPRQSSRAPSDTPPPSPAAPAHTPPIRHRESAAHSASHRQNSAPRTRTLLLLPTSPHNSAASASPLPLPLPSPQNNRTQTRPAAPSASIAAGK